MIEEVKYGGKVYRPIQKETFEEVQKVFYAGLRHERNKLFVFCHTTIPYMEEVWEVCKSESRAYVIIYSEHVHYFPVGFFDLFYEVNE